MSKSISGFSILAIVLFSSAGASAENQDEPLRPNDTTTNANIVNSEGKYKGDKLSFPYDVVLEDSGSNSKYCLPSGEEVRVQAYDDKTYEVYRVSNWGWTSKSDRRDEEKLRQSVLLGAQIAKANTDDLRSKAISEKVAEGKAPTYYCVNETAEYLPRRQLVRAEINKGGFIPDNAVMSGFSYGVLLVPYKYYTDSKNFGGAVTVAPFAGYRIDWSNIGLEATLVGFAGPTSLQGKDQSGDSTNLFGLSFGGGLLFEIKNDFNLGFVLGADKVSKSDRPKFEDDSDLWLAISLGFDFSN